MAVVQYHPTDRLIHAAPAPQFMALQNIAKTRKVVIQCLGICCYPCSLLKCSCLAVAKCCEILSERHVTLCEIDFCDASCCEIERGRPINCFDLVSRALNPCVCCTYCSCCACYIDWGHVQADDYLYPHQYRKYMHLKAQLLQAEPATEA